MGVCLYVRPCASVWMYVNYALCSSNHEKQEWNIAKGLACHATQVVAATKKRLEVPNMTNAGFWSACFNTYQECWCPAAQDAYHLRASAKVAYRWFAIKSASKTCSVRLLAGTLKMQRKMPKSAYEKAESKRKVTAAINPKSIGFFFKKD